VTDSSGFSEKVKKYLFENIGHLTSSGIPRFDIKNQTWKVPVLCKTARGQNYKSFGLQVSYKDVGWSI